MFFRVYSDLAGGGLKPKKEPKKKYKGLSYSNREGIDEKLKSMAQPYKMKVLKKS